ncbi:uncharacterized protein LOC117108847 [Anneissia japonica]|uniref:uncharacterized protein LOC117108847 n=1 Tax=Anneissia japonica TaxID=1529436 RepID=UPI0014255BE4|nr:uncharacterized protein LOC117108847 [Anneissia japonica]
MALFRKCCWCGVRRGSILAALFSMILFTLLFIFYYKMHRNAKQTGENKDMLWLYYVTYVFSVMIFISAGLVIRGIADDRRDSRMLLMPFVVLMSMYVVIQISAWIQAMVSGSPVYIIILFILAIGLCVSIVTSYEINYYF